MTDDETIMEQRAKENQLFWELELHLSRLVKAEWEAFVLRLMDEFPASKLPNCRVGRRLRKLYLELCDTPIYRELCDER